MEVAGEKRFVDFYVPYVYVLTTTSLILNAVLSIVIYAAPTKHEQYLKYTISFVVANVIFSIASVIIMPVSFLEGGQLGNSLNLCLKTSYSIGGGTVRPTDNKVEYWYQFPQVMALFSISPLSSSIDTTFIRMWYIIVAGVVILVFSSFVHRYAVLCNSFLKPYLKSKWGLIIIIVIPFSTALWIDATCRTLMSSDVSSVKSRLNAEIGLDIGIEFETITVAAITVEDVEKSPFAIAMFFILSIQLVTIYMGIIYCAWAINRTIKRAAFSVSLRKKHLKALRQLLLQSINPLVFLYGPFTLMFFASILTEGCHVPEKISDLMIHCFPISNAIVILSMTDEYRRTLIKRASIATNLTLS